MEISFAGGIVYPRISSDNLALFRLAGISINIISLSGLILGVGMIVDNSIIVIDNILQKQRGGAKLEKAVCKGTASVFAPMLSSVLTTCSVSYH